MAIFIGQKRRQLVRTEKYGCAKIEHALVRKSLHRHLRTYPVQIAQADAQFYPMLTQSENDF